MKVVFKALDRRLDARSTAPLVVALSGGGDSLALLYMAAEWARQHQRRLLALTVDHGLNPASGAWTAEAGAAARMVGATWRGLAWIGAKPSKGVPARARHARHALLGEAAREHGANVILMGHTANDLAEGDLMRETETPGLGRLREWSPSPAWPEGRGLYLLRPLLEVGRTDLRRYLAQSGSGWLDDPANEDLRFARIRARQALALKAPDPVRLERPNRVNEFGWPCAEQVRFDLEGALTPRTIPKPALAALLLCVAGESRPPRSEEMQRLMAVVAAGGEAMLSHCRIETRGEHLRITRAPPRRGRISRPVDPTPWIEQRFRAACGLYQSEAALPALE